MNGTHTVWSLFRPSNVCFIFLQIVVSHSRDIEFTPQCPNTILLKCVILPTGSFVSLQICFLDGLPIKQVSLVKPFWQIRFAITICPRNRVSLFFARVAIIASTLMYSRSITARSRPIFSWLLAWTRQQRSRYSPALQRALRWIAMPLPRIAALSMAQCHWEIRDRNTPVARLCQRFASIGMFAPHNYLR